MHLSYKLILVCASTAFVSCKTLNQPFDASTGINPLDIAGGSGFAKAKATGETNGSGLLAGDYVETSLPNTAFYASMPNSGSTPKGVLAQGVVLKVISSEGSFVHVQALTGETGYVANAAVVPQGLLTANVPLAPEAPPVVEPQTPEEIVVPEPEMPDLAPPPTAPIPAEEPSGQAPEPEIPGIQE